MSKKAVISGSFDPVTIGHIDLIERTSKLFDQLVVLVMQNSAKETMFTLDQRCQAVKAACSGLSNVSVDKSQGLLSDYVKNNNIDVIVKGVRNSIDYEYEKDMYRINNQIGDCETMLIFSRPELEYCSSTFVREMLKYKRDISGYVPSEALEYLK